MNVDSSTAAVRVGTLSALALLAAGLVSACSTGGQPKPASPPNVTGLDSPMGLAGLPIPSPRLPDPDLRKEFGKAKKETGQAAAAVTQVAKTATDIQERISKQAGNVIEGVVGADTRKFADDLRMALGANPSDGVLVAQAVENFVKTGNSAFLDPIAALAAQQIERTRNAYWAQANEYPKDMLDQLPREMADVARTARWILVSEASFASLPGIADREHKVQAIVMKDLIFFKINTPTRASNGDNHAPFLWAHETFHVWQYARWGVPEFAKRWLKYHTGQGFRLMNGNCNEVEVAADEWAMQYFPIRECPNFCVRGGLVELAVG